MVALPVSLPFNQSHHKVAEPSELLFATNGHGSWVVKRRNLDSESGDR